MPWPSALPRLVRREQLAAQLPAAAAAHPTSSDPGASRPPRAMPDGYDHTEVSVELGPHAFERAAEVVASLDLHREAGLLVTGAGPAHPVTVGATVVLGVPLGPLALVVPCRVTWVSDTGDERGFGYATLPHHPEVGEEAFVVRREPGGAVTFTVRAFARPAGLSRLVAPLARRAAGATVARYLAAARELTA